MDGKGVKYVLGRFCISDRNATGRFFFLCGRSKSAADITNVLAIGSE